MVSRTHLVELREQESECTLVRSEAAYPVQKKVWGVLGGMENTVMSLKKLISPNKVGIIADTEL